MANEEHLDILKQGVETWNAWRSKNPTTEADLKGTNLKSAILRDANFRWTNLNEANLEEADLSGADLSGVDLRHASFRAATLRGTTFRGADLRDAKLIWADLRDADLRGALLGGANLRSADLSATNLRGAFLSETTLANVDLTEAIGLNYSEHNGPSIVDHRTLKFSKNVPINFWRGCGLPEALIDYMPSLLNQAIQFYSCFISYSSDDQAFANRLHADLQNNGVRCWFAPHNMRTGDRIRDTIDEQIRVHDKLLLILSESSVESNWVDNEVEAAMDKEKNRKSVLFPVSIDDAVKDCDVAWARTIKRTRHIGDFSGWKDHDVYKAAFQRLLRDLTVEP